MFSPHELAEPPQYQHPGTFAAWLTWPSGTVRRAAAEFQKVLDHRGIVLNFVTGRQPFHFRRVNSESPAFFWDKESP
jgi:hypothetical protein